jgi:hypothetical protein
MKLMRLKNIYNLQLRQYFRRLKKGNGPDKIASIFNCLSRLNVVKGGDEINTF